jgi:sugar/nucleoside kinase (ribokinase family)
VQDSDISVVGHFAVDKIRLPSQPTSYTVLGGPATYVSLVARRLEGSVAAISKVGGDFPEAYLWWLWQEGIDVSSVVKLPHEKTTRFDLEYSKDLAVRSLNLKSMGSPICISDLPSTLKAKIIHLAPIDGEISCDLAENLKGHTELLSLDPQGLLRKFDAMGNVTIGLPVDKSLLSLVNIYKSSQDEITALTGCSDLNSAIKTIHDFGAGIVIVNLGSSGSVLSAEQTIYRIPAYGSTTVIDPTGAGDAFVGGFLTEYTRQKDSFWCACVGSAAASLVIEDVGPRFFGDKEEIYRRAWSIYEKEIKQ